MALFKLFANFRACFSEIIRLFLSLVPDRRGIERWKNAIRSAVLPSQHPPRAARHHGHPYPCAYLKRRRRAEPRVLHFDPCAQAQVFITAPRRMPERNDHTGLAACPASTAVGHLAAQRQAKRISVLRALRRNAHHRGAAHLQRRRKTGWQTADVQPALKASDFLPQAVYLLKDISAARLAAGMPGRRESRIAFFRKKRTALHAGPPFRFSFHPWTRFILCLRTPWRTGSKEKDRWSAIL